MWVKKKRLKKIWLRIRLANVRTKRRWLKNDRRFGIWWRLGNGMAAVLVLVAVAIPVLQQVALVNSYHLSADALKLVGSTDQKLTKQLTYDTQSSTYEFNKSAVKSDAGNPLAKLQSQVGTASGSSKDKSLYALDVPADFSKGVTYHDINSQLGFSVVPQFKASPAKVVAGHLVFPLAGHSQAVYTLKNNGLKEDIVVQKPAGDSMSFSYNVKLPDSLALKAIPNSGGAVGIYSGDPALFGDMSYGSDSDRTAVDLARKKAEKTYLVFGLPSPIVKDTNGKQIGSARFEINGTTLSVVATGLAAATTPVTIDPSVVVTSTSDFQTGGNNEENINFSTTGQVTRDGMTGGTVGTWSTTTALGANVEAGQAIAYNGYLYQMGGYTQTPTAYTSTVQYAALNTNGTIGTWTSTTSLPTTLNFFGAVAYNGYMYEMGGLPSGGTTPTSAVYFAVINSNGTLGSWTSTTSLPTINAGLAAVAYNGYIYVLGGGSTTPGTCGASSACYSTVYYAASNGDGTMGSWTTATAMTNTRALLSVNAYNGYLYYMGGANTGFLTDVKYAPINNDGSIGSWTASTSFNTARDSFVSYMADGYLYIVGGLSAGPTYQNDVQYAPIYATGKIGTFQTTTTFSTGRYSFMGAAYNGYIYILGGYDGASDHSDVQYAKVDTAGSTGPWHYTSSSTDNGTTFSAGFTNTRNLHCSVAYNNFIYAMGGTNGSTFLSVQLAPVNNDGTVGTWNSGTALINGTGRYAAGCAAYNGYIYFLTGLSSNNTTLNTDVMFAPLAANGTVGTWNYTHNSTNDGTTFVSGTLGGGRSGAGVAVYNGYLYVVGGNSGSNLNDVQYAPLNSDGTVGIWHYTHASTDDGTTFSAGFTTARTSLQVIASGGYLYVIGGTNGSTYYNDVQYAAINANGTIGTWSSTSSFTTARSNFASFVANGALYVVGGKDGTNTYGDTQYAPINSNGTLGTWTTTASLNTLRQGETAVSQNGFAYVLGGQNAGTYYNDAQFAQLNMAGDGIVGNWNSNATDLTTPYASGWANGGSFVANKYIYLVGGVNGATGSSVANVYAAPINSDGTIGSWAATSSMSSARSLFALGIYKGYVYVYGGSTAGADVNNYEYAKVNTNGTVGTWTADATMNLSAGSVSIRSGVGGAVSPSGYLYLVGGSHSGTYYTDVYYAPINTNGTVGTWASTASFTGTRDGAAVTAYDGYIYLAGGYNGTSYLADTQYAVMNSNGTVGTWVSGGPMLLARGYASIVGYNGFLYVVGGNASSAPTRIEYASINANGSLQQFQRTTAIPTARYGSALAAYGGELVLIGGYKPGTLTYATDVLVSQQLQAARVGHYSKLLDFGTLVNVTGLALNGTAQTYFGTVTFRAATGTALFGSLSANDNLTGSGSCIGTGVATRYIWVNVFLDDSLGYGGGGFPDSASPLSTVTDMTFTYSPTHPAPNIRLRTGQTLQSGLLSALDTCGA